MEVFPIKIDWNLFKTNFPDGDPSWERPLKAKFPMRDFSGRHDAYSTAFEDLAKHLPASLRKPLGLFVAATGVNSIASVDFTPYAPAFDGDAEELMDMAVPQLDPKRMKKVAKALEAILAVDYQSAINQAWEKADFRKDSIVAKYMKNSKEFIAHLELWIKAFEEIHNEGAVLGIGIA